MKARAQLMRDMGICQSAFCAYIINLGLETLHLRMERHSQNALKCAEYLESDPRVSWVNFPALKSSEYFDLCKKYLPNGAGGVISLGVKGGREAACRFIDNLKMIKLVTTFADLRSSAIHPASTTQSQLTDEELKKAGVGSDMVRLSIGIEHIDDILDDIKQALDKI
jgi:O-acetylhomoserine (thiol)-lyase